MSDFTSDELASVGYKKEVAVPDFSIEDLASVGYKAPRPVQQTAGMGDLLMAGATGFLGEASDLVGGAVRGIGKIAGSEGVQQIGQDTIDYGKKMSQAAQNANPTAAGVGKTGADVVGVLAGAQTIPGMLASSALAGIALSPEDANPTQIIMNAAKGAAIAGGVAGALTIGTKLVAAGVSKVAPIVKNIAAGTKAAMTNADDYATAALDNTLKATGGDLAKSTPEQVVASIDAVQKQLKSTASNLYELRDVAAQQAGIKVAKANVQQAAAALEADIATGATEGTVQGLKAAKKILGTVDAPIPFAKAQSLMSNLSESAADAASQGNAQLARQLGSIKDALGADIEAAAAASPDVMKLHKAATDFYRESYSPIAGLEMQRQIANKITQNQFVANLVKDLGKKQAVTSGFEALPSEVKQQVLGAHLQALADSAASSGVMDLGKYSKSLEASLQKNPALYKLTDTVSNMQTLAQVIGAKFQTSTGSIKLRDAGIVAAGFAATGAMNPGFMATAAIPIAMHLHAAGKIIRSEAGRGILKTVQKLAEYPESALAKEASNKVLQLYINQFRNISAKAMSLLSQEG